MPGKCLLFFKRSCPNYFDDLQKATTYALHWPNSMVYDGGLGKSADEASAMLLIDYQYTNQTFSFDEDGNYSWANENIEGDESIRLPNDIWESTKDLEPSRDPSNAAVFRSTYSDGLFQRVNTNGEVVFSTSFDQSEYQIDPEFLTAYLEYFECDTCVLGRRESILASLEESGVSFNVVENNVMLESDFELEGYSRIKKVIDLGTGLTVKSATYRDDGRFGDVRLSSYEKVNGYYVKNHAVNYYFGEINGNWQAKTVTYVDRSIINVTRGQL